jgi:hypothetical protein
MSELKLKKGLVFKAEGHTYEVAGHNNLKKEVNLIVNGAGAPLAFARASAEELLAKSATPENGGGTPGGTSGGTPPAAGSAEAAKEGKGAKIAKATQYKKLKLSNNTVATVTEQTDDSVTYQVDGEERTVTVTIHQLENDLIKNRHVLVL